MRTYHGAAEIPKRHVIDRGGWPPTLDAELDLAGFDILTYRGTRPAGSSPSATE